MSERSGEVIEPLLSLQWFVKMKPLAEPALQAYRDGRLRFVPERYGRTYETWLENIRDWNISRQLWWGHQLPVWYTPAGDVVVAETEEEALEIARTRLRRAHRSRAIPIRSTPGSRADCGRSRSWVGRRKRSSCSAGIRRKC